MALCGRIGATSERGVRVALLGEYARVAEVGVRDGVMIMLFGARRPGEVVARTLDLPSERTLRPPWEAAGERRGFRGAGRIPGRAVARDPVRGAGASAGLVARCGCADRTDGLPAFREPLGATRGAIAPRFREGAGFDPPRGRAAFEVEPRAGRVRAGGLTCDRPLLRGGAGRTRLDFGRLLDGDLVALGALRFGLGPDLPDRAFGDEPRDLPLRAFGEEPRDRPPLLPRLAEGLEPLLLRT